MISSLLQGRCVCRQQCPSGMQRQAEKRLSEPLSLGWLFVVALALIGSNAFFAAADAAIAHTRVNRIEEVAGGRPSRIPEALSIMASRELYTAACRLGRALTATSLGGVAYFTADACIYVWITDNVMHAGKFIWLAAVGVVYAVLVPIYLVLGELVPIRAVSRNAESALLRLAPPLAYFYLLISPAARLLLRVAKKSMNDIEIDPAHGYGDAHTEADLRTLMKESHQRGYIDQTELTLVDNIFEFTDTTAREIMIPRIDMICLRAGLSLAANKAIAIQHMRTRYPVCEHDKDNIIGFVHIKDLLKEDLRLPNGIASLIRPVTTVPENIHISVLLKLMQKKRSQIAILIDEYGGTSGLVTLEDIMEQIVGDIQDEFDTDSIGIIKRDDGTHSISGLMLIEEVNSFFGTSIDTDEYDTIGGYMYARVDFPPAPGQQLALDSHYELWIEEVLHLRITRISVCRLDSVDRSIDAFHSKM